MLELGELEANHAEFEKRGVRIYAISNDDQKHSQQTQDKFPHLTIVADTNQNLAKEVRMLHAGTTGPDGIKTNVPAIILVDGEGRVRWMYQSPQVIERLSPQQVLDAVDEHVLQKT